MGARYYTHTAHVPPSNLFEKDRENESERETIEKPKKFQTLSISLGSIAMTHTQNTPTNIMYIL